MGDVDETADRVRGVLVAFPQIGREDVGGRAGVIIRGKEGTPGQIKVTAKSPGLTFAQTIIDVR